MNYFVIAFLGFMSACSASCGSSANSPVFDPNGPVAVAAIDIAGAVLAHEQPAVNAAIQELPEEVQVLAQTAYGALQAVIAHIDSMQPKRLAIHDPNTVNDTNELKNHVLDVSNQLDSLIH